jgi:hypothetical protein
MVGSPHGERISLGSAADCTPQMMEIWHRGTGAIKLSQAGEARCTGHEDESLDLLGIAQCNDRSSR